MAEVGDFSKFKNKENLSKVYNLINDMNLWEDFKTYETRVELVLYEAISLIWICSHNSKTQFPEKDWYISSYDSKIKKTIGKQNADFQITRFNNNAQPFYVVIDPFSEKIVYRPWGYELNVESYISHLENGITKFYEE